MGTTKKLVVLCLVLLMGITAIMPSTFSWYDHSGELTGDRMSYEKENLPVSDGSLSTTTKKYRMASNTAVYYDIKGNKEYSGGAITPISESPESIAAKHSQYYGTVIENSSSSPAYVNLYLQSFKNNNAFSIGTMEPSLREKGVSSSVHLKNMNSIRLYFQWSNANDWKNGSAAHYVVYKTKTSSNLDYRSFSDSTYAGVIDNSKDTHNYLSGKTTYYIDLPDDTTSFYFATNGNNNGFNTSDCSTTMNWYRTNTITDVQAERCYYLTGVADDTTFCAQYNTFSIPGGISVRKYFNTAEMNNGQKAYVSLTKGTHYTGSTISYSGSGDLTVNSGSGLITRTGITPSTVTTTITGSLGDTKTVTTNVSTPTEVAAMPLALNVKVPPKEDGVNGKAEVVWYIKNESTDTACTFKGIYYTK